MSSVFPPAYADLGDDLPTDRQVAQLRIPPHSLEAESSVLGGLLLDNNAWDRVGDVLIDSDFYRYEHRLVYAAIGKLINETKPADVITEIAQESVATPKDVMDRIGALKEQGRKNALLMLASKTGELRFVTIRMD